MTPVDWILVGLVALCIYVLAAVRFCLWLNRTAIDRVRRAAPPASPAARRREALNRAADPSWRP